MPVPGFPVRPQEPVRAPDGGSGWTRIRFPARSIVCLRTLTSRLIPGLQQMKAARHSRLAVAAHAVHTVKAAIMRIHVRKPARQTAGSQHATRGK